jgi:hypothetical protein
MGPIIYIVDYTQLERLARDKNTLRYWAYFVEEFIIISPGHSGIKQFAELICKLLCSLFC